MEENGRVSSSLSAVCSMNQPRNRSLSSIETCCRSLIAGQLICSTIIGSRPQLTALERRTSRGGRDSIDHAPGAHDDIANAVAGALVTAYKRPGVKNFNRPIQYPHLGIV